MTVIICCAICARMTRIKNDGSTTLNFWQWFARTSIYCLLNESMPSHLCLINEWEIIVWVWYLNSEFDVTNIWDCVYNLSYYTTRIYSGNYTHWCVWVFLVGFWFRAIQIPSALVMIIKRSTEKSTMFWNSARKY